METELLPLSKPKRNFKLSIVAKAELLSMASSEPSNNKIIEYIQSKYNVLLTSGYITHVRDRSKMLQVAFFNRDLKNTLKKKTRIHNNSLDIMDKSVTLLKVHISHLKAPENPMDIKLVLDILKEIKGLYELVDGFKQKAPSINVNLKSAMDG